MRITVVIPAMNEENTVGVVVKQVPRPFVDEVIVVDNASTDDTAVSLCLAFQHQLWHYCAVNVSMFRYKTQMTQYLLRAVLRMVINTKRQKTY